MLAQVVDSPSEEVATTMPVSMSLSAATDLQGHLMVASNDLERLQGLLDDASQTKHLCQPRRLGTGCLQRGQSAIRPSRVLRAQIAARVDFSDTCASAITGRRD